MTETADAKNKVSIYKVEILHRAIERGDTEGVKRFLMKNPKTVMAINQSGETALHKAIRLENIEALTLIVKHGVDVNLQEESLSNNMNTPLNLAIRMGHLTVAQTLLDLGANPYLKNNSQKNALHMALLGNDIKIIDELLSRGMNLNTIEDAATGYFVYATGCCNKAVLTHLLKRGIDLWQIEAAFKEVPSNFQAIFSLEQKDIYALLDEYKSIHMERLALEKTVSEVINSQGEASIDNEEGQPQQPHIVIPKRGTRI